MKINLTVDIPKKDWDFIKQYFTRESAIEHIKAIAISDLRNEAINAKNAEEQLNGNITETHKNGKVYKGLVGFIESRKEFLQECLDTGVAPNPEMTAWKIKLYEFILKSDEPEKKFDEYTMRKKQLGTPKDEKGIVLSLGWEF